MTDYDALTLRCTGRDDSYARHFLIPAAICEGDAAVSLSMEVPLVYWAPGQCLDTPFPNTGFFIHSDKRQSLRRPRRPPRDEVRLPSSGR